MPESKSPRREAMKRLAAFSRGKRDSASAPIDELYPFGLYSEGPRDPVLDRDTVISSVAALEQTLEEAILGRINQRDDADDILCSGQTPILRDLNDKIRMAYLLGIIGWATMRDLGCIRAIRNGFAHTRGHLDLDMLQFTDLIAHITAPDRWPEYMEGCANKNARERFIQTCFQVSMYLSIGTENSNPKRIMAERRRTFQQ